MGAGQGNPVGHFEFVPFVEINDELLASFGGSWSDPPTFPDGWEGSEGVAKVLHRARRWIDQCFRRVPSWAFKDPRTCLTMPFWFRAVDSEIDIIHIVRNPLDVALSLRIRNDIPVAVGAALWERYTTESMKWLRGTRRLLISYDSIVDDTDFWSSRLASFLATDDSHISEMREFARAALRHHRSTVGDLEANPEICDSVKKTYAGVLQAMDS